MRKKCWLLLKCLISKTNQEFRFSLNAKIRSYSQIVFIPVQICYMQIAKVKMPSQIKFVMKTLFFWTKYKMKTIRYLNFIFPDILLQLIKIRKIFPITNDDKTFCIITSINKAYVHVTSLKTKKISTGELPKTFWSVWFLEIILFKEEVRWVMMLTFLAQM